MGAQIALRQVVLRPLEQLIEALAIVGRESEEQRVALPFGGGDFARIAGVDDPPFGADIRFLNCSQAGHWQAALTCPAASINTERSTPRNAFISNYSSSGSRRRRLRIRSMRHSTHASSTMLTAARIANSIGWLESANQMRSNHGRWPT